MKRVLMIGVVYYLLVIIVMWMMTNNDVPLRVRALYYSHRASWWAAKRLAKLSIWSEDTYRVEMAKAKG